MAAILRSAIGRARSAVPEKLLILLRGPRPCPAAANSAEVDLLAKKVADGGKEDKMNELLNSLIQVGKKKYEPPIKDWDAVPLVIAMSLTSVFALGCRMGRDDAAKIRKLYASDLKNLTESSRV